MTLSFDPALLVSRHTRCHTGAEYLAEIASSVGPDTAMAAREISAGLFELFELIRQHAPAGPVQLTLSAMSGGVDVRAFVPGDGRTADRYVASVAPADHDPLAEPHPGDGLRELAAIHGVTVQATAAPGGALLELHVPLHAPVDEQAPDAGIDGAGGVADGR